jgi:hypothetical protein
MPSLFIIHYLIFEREKLFMLCSKCGNQNKGTAKFCGVCGNKLNQDVSSVPKYSPPFRIKIILQPELFRERKLFGSQAPSLGKMKIIRQPKLLLWEKMKIIRQPKLLLWEK